MKLRHVAILSGLVFAAHGVSSVEAAEKPWSFSVYVGDSISGSGTLRKDKSVTVPTPTAIDPKLAGATATVAIKKLNYEDVFNNRYAAGLELGYAPGEHLLVYGRANYNARQGRNREIGVLSSTALPGRHAIHARFGDSDSQSLEAGIRYLWLDDSKWRPFVGLSLGATHTDDVKASLSIADTVLQRREVRFARSGTAFSQTFETGVEYNPNRRLGVRLSVRADHVGEPKGADDPTLTALGFHSNDQAYSRYSFPIAVAAVYRF
ncbi:MAG: hypothetical protein WDO72_06135 [Pseudomonadota bacterium]